MLENLKLNKVIFIDTETVPEESSYENLSEDWKTLWDRKASFLSRGEEETSDELYNKAGIYAEFGKVVCISVGVYRQVGTKKDL